MDCMSTGKDRVIVVDLDGTLVHSDLLVESIFLFLKRYPLRFWRLFFWLLKGKANLKRRLAETVVPSAQTLPYNSALVSWLEEQRVAGARLVLATASDLRLADAIASHTSIFDEVLGTQERNLAAGHKREALVSLYGELGYEYVGNSAAAFPMRACGVEVVEVPTTLLSNHPRYSTMRGKVLEPDLVANILAGLAERGAHERAAVILTGFLGRAETAGVVADFVARAKSANPRIIYACDPVMGDADLGFFAELSERFGAPGDFAAAYVVAHEIGHHVQTLLGLRSSNDAGANSGSVAFELQADCFAGVWGNSTSQRRLLEQGDVEEGLAAASAVGDDRIQAQMTGQIRPDKFTHGSAAQRAQWFRRGLESGDPNVCDTFGGLGRS